MTGSRPRTDRAIRRRPLSLRPALPVVAAATGALALGALGACGDDTTEPRPVDDAAARATTLVLNWTPNAHHLGVYAALAEGWYEEAGIDLRVVEPTVAGSDQVVGAGEAEFGVSVAEEVIPARAVGVPVVSLAAIIPVNDSALMVLPEAGVERPADLEGLTYGGFGGALELELISTLVACDGGDPDAVGHVEVGDVDYLAGMDAGRFDTAWVFVGWDGLRAEVVLGRDVDYVRFSDHEDCIPNWYTPVLTTSERMLSEEPDLVVAFVEATARGYRLAVEEPQRAATLMLDLVPEADDALLRAAADHYATRFAPDGVFGVQDRQTWADFDAFLVGSGLTDASIDVDEAFTNAFLPSGA